MPYLDSPVRGVGGTLSGRVGDTVYAHNTHGPYAYHFTPRVDPATSRQTYVRGFLTNAAMIWTMPYEQPLRDAWNTYAANLARPNAVARRGRPTGLNYFVASRVFRGQNSLYPPVTFPEVFTLGRYHPLRFRPRIPFYTHIRFDFDLTDPWRFHDYAGWGVYSSLPLPATVNYFTGPFRHLWSAVGNSTNPPTGISAPLPVPPVSGQVMFFRSRISEGDGRLSPAIIQRVYFR